MSAILGNWSGASTTGGGFKAAAIVGFWLAIAFGLGFYSMTTLPISVMSYVDPLVSAVYYGAGGAAIGWYLGRGTPSQI